MLHRKIIDPVLEALPKERALYFTGVARRLEADPRIERAPNLAFTVLRETMELAPIYLAEGEFVDLLFAFCAEHERELDRAMLDRRYVAAPSFIHPITNEFVRAVAARAFDLYQSGELDGGEQSEIRFSFPADDDVSMPLDWNVKPRKR